MLRLEIHLASGGERSLVSFGNDRYGNLVTRFHHGHHGDEAQVGFVLREGGTCGPRHAHASRGILDTPPLPVNGAELEVATNRALIALRIGHGEFDTLQLLTLQRSAGSIDADTQQGEEVTEIEPLAATYRCAILVVAREAACLGVERLHGGQRAFQRGDGGTIVLLAVGIVSAIRLVARAHLPAEVRLLGIARRQAAEQGVAGGSALAVNAYRVVLLPQQAQVAVARVRHIDTGAALRLPVRLCDGGGDYFRVASIHLDHFHVAARGHGPKQRNGQHCKSKYTFHFFV